MRCSPHHLEMRELLPQFGHDGLRVPQLSRFVRGADAIVYADQAALRAGLYRVMDSRTHADMLPSVNFFAEALAFARSSFKTLKLRKTTLAGRRRFFFFFLPAPCPADVAVGFFLAALRFTFAALRFPRAFFGLVFFAIAAMRSLPAWAASRRTVALPRVDAFFTGAARFAFFFFETFFFATG